VEEVPAEIEGISEAVRGIDAHDERPVTVLREMHAGGGRDARFAYAAFAAVEKNSHTSIMRFRRAEDLHDSNNFVHRPNRSFTLRAI
jgi:hypothetical protein